MSNETREERRPGRRQSSQERRARREERRQRARATSAQMQQVNYQVPRFNLINDDAVQRVHDTSMHILSKLGIAFYDEEVCTIMAAHGARVDGDMVYMDEALVMDHVAKAPAEFTQIARNPAHNVIFGGQRSVFAPVYGPPFVADMDRGRREATIEDFDNFIKLAYLSPYIHHSGGTVVEPNDLPVPTRHLDMIYSHVRYSDKAFMGSVTDAVNAEDSIAMAELVFGKEAMQKQSALLSLINVSSPRRYDDRMLGCIKVYARARQAMIITPFLMAGAMSPASIAGTLALQNAEALAGIVLTQMINPGTPVIYGSFMTNLDLQSGATVFGSPESQLTLLAVAQMAARYNLPFRSGGTFTSAKLPDAQSGYESVQVMMPAILAQTNFVLHAAGWLESGLTAGYEKFVIDCELLGMAHKWAQGIDFSDEAFAMDAFAEVPPGGHFLGTEHTMRNFRTAFHHPEVFDYDAYEQWVEKGSNDTYALANRKWKTLLKSYQAPALEPALDAELQAFMRVRKQRLGFPASE